MSRVRWYGHVLRKNTGDVLRRALDFEGEGRRGREQPNIAWKKQVEKHIDQVELKKKDAIDRTKLLDGIYKLLKI